MSWAIKYIKEAEQDFANLDGSQKKYVLKAIEKVSQNPISVFEGGYGKPLGNMGGNNLAGMYKIKIRNAGLRVVYFLERDENKIMRIIVISVRADNEVYNLAAKRIRKMTF